MNDREKRELLEWIIKWDTIEEKIVAHELFFKLFAESEKSFNAYKFLPGFPHNTYSHCTSVLRSAGDGIYEVSNPEKDAMMDIIFLHGLDGNAITSWTARDTLNSFWPREWLAKVLFISLRAARIFQMPEYFQFSMRLHLVHGKTQDIVCLSKREQGMYWKNCTK